MEKAQGTLDSYIRMETMVYTTYLIFSLILYLMVLKIIFLGCGIQAYPMLFYYLDFTSVVMDLKPPRMMYQEPALN